jgi:hypothetical protein
LITDLTDKEFGKLRVLGFIGKNKYNYAIWNCACECGNTKEILGTYLIRGFVKSCGCATGYHGFTSTPTYYSWAQMVQRCTNPNNDRAKDYLDRGIKLYPPWRKFINFLNDMGERPPGTSIERKDNDGDYTPDNCKWGTPKEQSNNTRRNINITHDGKTMSVSQWARHLGIEVGTLHSRIRRHWEPGEALTKPVQYKQVRC